MNERTAPPSIEVLSLDFPLPVSEYIHSLSVKYHNVIGYLGDVHHLCTKNAPADPLSITNSWFFFRKMEFYNWNIWNKHIVATQFIIKRCQTVMIFMTLWQIDWTVIVSGVFHWLMIVAWLENEWLFHLWVGFSADLSWKYFMPLFVSLFLFKSRLSTPDFPFFHFLPSVFRPSAQISVVLLPSLER